MDKKTFDDDLQQYFRDHKKEIGDDGFTKSVMQKLPRKRSPYYIVYLFLFLGFFLFIQFNGYSQLLLIEKELIRSIGHLRLPSMQSIGIVTAFTVVMLSILTIDKEDTFVLV